MTPGRTTGTARGSLVPGARLGLATPTHARLLMLVLPCARNRARSMSTARRGGRDNKADWGNELHPTKSGFAKVTAKVAAAL